MRLPSPRRTRTQVSFPSTADWQAAATARHSAHRTPATTDAPAVGSPVPATCRRVRFPGHRDAPPHCPARGRSARHAHLRGVRTGTRRPPHPRIPLLRSARRRRSIRSQAFGQRTSLLHPERRGGATRLRDVRARRRSPALSPARWAAGALSWPPDHLRGARPLPALGTRNRANRRRCLGAGLSNSSSRSWPPRVSSIPSASAPCPFCRAGWVW